MAQEKVKILASERKRRLKQLTFEASSTLTLDLPRDTVYKHLLVRLSGAVQTTFASGTPVADEFGPLHNLVNKILVIANGSNVIKNVTPHFMRMQQLFVAVEGERKASAAAAAASESTVDVTAFPYGSTTHYTTLSESIMISFENVYAMERAQKSSTWLNAKGLASLTMEFHTSAFSKLLGFGNTAPVTYGNSTLALNVSTIEAQHIPAEVVTGIWKQTVKNISVSSEVTAQQVDINEGNKLQALSFICQDGAAGSATTASGKLRSDLLLVDMALKINGQTSIQSTKFKELQAENVMRYAIDDPLASNINRTKGFARMDFTQDGHLQTALDVSKAAGVDDVKFEYSTGSSSDVSYTNPANIGIMTDELLPPR